jgi:hypothetical protein
VGKNPEHIRYTALSSEISIPYKLGQIVKENPGNFSCEPARIYLWSIFEGSGNFAKAIMITHHPCIAIDAHWTEKYDIPFELV